MHGTRTRRHAGCVTTLVTLVALVGPISTPASAAVPDQVLKWNKHAYDELIIGQPGIGSLFSVAMVHGAIYDAVNAIDGGHEPYLGAPAALDSYSEDAAAAAAAYRVMLHLLPGRATQLGTFYQESLDAIPDGAAESGGVQVGELAAAAMIAARQNDGRVGGDPLFTTGTGTGEWRPVLPGANNFKWVGQVRPFLVLSGSQFRTHGPLSVNSDAYSAEFNQVKALGRATGSTRTAEQTEIALFWSDNAFAMWNRVFRQIAGNEHLSTAENARLFAMLFLTGSDAAINCFNDKEFWHFWRPTTAIREADTDGNPNTAADPEWTSLVAVPPYPDHPSGHNCFSSSVVATLQDFFGTNELSFSATHATLGITRSFTHISHAIAEIKRARVYGGLHFMTADAQAIRLGRLVAAWRQAHYFQPVA